MQRSEQRSGSHGHGRNSLKAPAGRKWGIAAGVCALSLLVLGCGPEEAVCIPDAAKPALTLDDAPTPPAVPTSVDLYLDATGSMKGFLKKPRKPAPITFQTVLGAVVQYVESRAPEPNKAHKIFAFGKCVDDITSSFVKNATALNEGFYANPKACGGKGMSQETEFERVFTNIKERHAAERVTAPNRLSIVLTDLFLTEHGGIGEIERAMKPLGQLIETGLSIGVLGLKVPFDGNLDLPKRSPESKEVFPYVGSVALYLVVIGNPKQIDDLRRELGYGDEWTAGNADNAHFHLFTRDRIETRLLETAALSNEAGRPLPTEPAAVKNGAKAINTFAIADDRVWTATAKIASLRGTWPIDSTIESQTWLFGGGGPSCQEGWRAATPVPAKVELGDSTIRLSVTSDQVPPQLTFLTHVTLTGKVGHDAPPPKLPAWVAKWSVQASEASTLDRSSKRDYFPTVDLTEILRRLEKSALEAARPQDRVIADFNVAYLKRN